MAKRKGADPEKDIARIIQAVKQDADGIRTVVFNSVKGLLARRVFNQGLATDESRIGNYKPATKKIRQELGYRIDTVDLEQTGTLRRSVVVGVESGRVVLGMAEQKELVVRIKAGKKTTRVKGLGTISNVGATNRSRKGVKTLSSDVISFHELSEITTTENALIQEKHFNKEIFAPSKKELERGEVTVIKELDRVVKKALQLS